jgi:uncharacterized damage-inducible protein DinB
MQGASSERAATLAGELHAAAEALVTVLSGIVPERWSHVPGEAIWSVGKDAAHVAEAVAYHQWIVRLTIGQTVSSRRPAIERRELTTALTPRQAIDLLLERTEEGVTLISSLTDEQLALPTRPPRARASSLAETIDLVMIDHYHGHRGDIERKLRDGP